MIFEVKESETTGTERVAVFPGSFNPFTIGHLSVLRRALDIFDRVVVLVGCNMSKGGCGGPDKELAKALSAKLSEQYRGVSVEIWSGLTVDAAERFGARWIVRGVRSAADFEYERNLADVNRRISGIETILLPAEPDLACISSSVVRELNFYGRDTSNYTI